MCLYQAEYEKNAAKLELAACKLDALSGAMREEIAAAGLIRIHDMLLNVVARLPQSFGSNDDDFLRDLRDVTGIVVIIAGNASNPPLLWRDFQHIAIELLDSLAGFKKLWTKMSDENEIR